jgi:ubiquinone/menaquinone biosynthesis C-methylase UbiE
MSFFCLKNRRPGTLLADIGCGNAKYAAKVPPGVTMIGIDSSVKLLEIASNRWGRVAETDSGGGSYVAVFFFFILSDESIVL